MPLVEVKQDGAIRTIALDHHEKRNALSKVLIAAVMDAVESYAHANVRASVLRAPSGAKVWSAGHDVDDLPEGRHNPLGWDDPLRSLVCAIDEFPAFVVAMIDGRVRGAACELASACDLIAATPNAPLRAGAGLRRIVYDSKDYAESSQAFRALPVAETLRGGTWISAACQGGTHGRPQELTQRFSR